MKEIARYDELSIPEWAASCLINNDASGLTQDEINMIFSYLENFETEGMVNIDLGDSPYFSHSPEFGLPCTCLEGTITVWISEQDNTQDMRI